MAAALFRRLNSIHEINDSKETWKIAVRLINMWTIPRSAKSIIELKLIDKDGDQIIAQMKNVDDKVLNVNFEIGETYVIQNFEVEKNIGQYKATQHAFKISFVKATKVTPHDMPEIPKRMYNFTMFDAIENGSATPDYLIDVIGEVVQIGQWNLDGKPKKVVFTMKDQCGSVISCTLWEALALEFKECFEKALAGPFILILTMAKIKEARGSYPIGIQNSMYGSQMFVNDDIEEILEFKNKMDPSQLTSNTCSQIGSQVSGSSLYSVADRFLLKACVKSLDQISQCKKDDFCVTVGTISKLLVANGWIYESCPKCNKKVDPVTLPFSCVACGNESGTTNPRFRVDVKVSQSGESAIFTLWDRECIALIKETAADIKDKMIVEEGEFDPRDMPEALDRLLGKTCAFRFKLIPENSRHSISQLCEDDGVINSVLAKLSTSALLDEPEASISLGGSQTNDLLDSQCFSATGESDSNLLSSTTPSNSKRIFSNTDSVLEDMPFEDLSQIQLSSTRLKKQIKKE